MRPGTFSRRRAVSAAAAAVFAVAIAMAGGAGAATQSTACTPRVLVIGAMPSEIGVPLQSATVSKVVKVADRRFYVGKLAGNNVIMAMSGIGLVNAEQTAEAAFQTFRCGTGPGAPARGISAVVFTGVSGGSTQIGDVMVPSQWRRSGTAAPWVQTDPTMFRVAHKAATTVKLMRKVPTGDPACACVVEPERVETVDLGRDPQVFFGGNGASADPFGGQRFFCGPNGGNVFGCEPCKYQERDPAAVQRFVEQAQPFLGPDFFLGFFQPGPSDPNKYVAGDMETAAVAEVAKKYGAPFIGFRALSDGAGDPLHLDQAGAIPFSWLAQFMYYQQVAADNAGRMAIEFLKYWAKR